jgi:hypothetical protein
MAAPSLATRMAALQPPAARVDPGPAKPPAESRRRAFDRPGSLFNDAQIASIKKRLGLTPDQERLWPAVETALRAIAYTKGTDSHGAAAGRLYIDPNGAEVQQLKMAALPLVMRLTEDQKREVRQIAHVLGLESVAAQF